MLSTADKKCFNYLSLCYNFFVVETGEDSNLNWNKMELVIFHTVSLFLICLLIEVPLYIIKCVFIIIV